MLRCSLVITAPKSQGLPFARPLFVYPLRRIAGERSQCEIQVRGSIRSMTNDLPARPEKSAYERLKRRHRKFVDAYVPGQTGAEAMREIGYKGAQPERRAWRLLKRPEIIAAVEERELHYIREMGVRAERIMRETVAIATSDPRRLEDENGKAIPLHKLDAATAAAISAVEVENISTNGETGTRYKYKLWDKNKALDKLGQYRKLWDTKGPTVNVDARSVTVNATGGAEALQGAIRLLEQARAIAAPIAATLSDTDGSVLPAAVRDEPPRRRASLDAGEDT